MEVRLAQTPEVIVPARPAAAVPACLLAWLIPGAGHLYLRRTGKGLVLLGAILALFLLGVAQDARLSPTSASTTRWPCCAASPRWRWACPTS